MDLSSFVTVWGNFIDSNDPDLQETARSALYSLSTLMLKEQIPQKTKVFFTDLQSKTSNWEHFIKKIGNVKNLLEELHNFFKKRSNEMSREMQHARGNRWGSDMVNMDNYREDSFEERKYSSSQEKKISPESQMIKNPQSKRVEVQNISIFDSPRPQFKLEESKQIFQPKYLEITEITQAKSRPLTYPINQNIKVLLGKPTEETHDYFIHRPYAWNTVRLYVKDQMIFLSETALPPTNQANQAKIMRIPKSKNLIQVKSAPIVIGQVFVFGKNEIVIKATTFGLDLVVDIYGQDPDPIEKTIADEAIIGTHPNCQILLDKDEEIHHFHAHLKREREAGWIIEAHDNSTWLWMGMHLRNTAAGRKDSNEYQIRNDSCIKVHESKYRVRLI